MTGDINQRLIARIRNRGGRPGRPRVVKMEPEVRTPIDIVPITQPDDADRRALGPLAQLDPNAPSFGPYLFEWQYDVRLESINAFHDWLKNYEDKLRKLCPEHYRYLGTFEALFGPNWQSQGGRYRTLWQHAELAGTLHLLHGTQKSYVGEEEDEYIKLLKELISFQNTDSSTRGSQLFQLVTSR